MHYGKGSRGSRGSRVLYCFSMENRWTNTAGLADALGVSTDQVVRWIEEGRVRAIRPHPRGQYRIERVEAERVVREAERRVAG